jgi:hypothetical protein
MTIAHLIELATARLAYLTASRALAEHRGDVAESERFTLDILTTEATLAALRSLPS